uniref:Cement protein-100k n=1 Tax=Megabalanus rosa TaxID=6680 RepID=Q9GZJ9_MEGRO|nr:cement protein-100k [Megabalanus rosa]
MMRLSLVAVLLVTVSVTGHRPSFERRCCGCLRSPVAADLDDDEIGMLREYVKKQGVMHYESLSDISLKAIFRNKLLNNFPEEVPATRDGVLQVITESLGSLTDSVVPSVSQCGQIAGYLQKSVPALAQGGFNVDLKSLVSSASVLLHQRGVTVNTDELNIFLKYGLINYLKSTVYQSSYSMLRQLIVTLDYLDHELPVILDYEELIAVRLALKKKFDTSVDIFKNRYQLAIQSYKANRNLLLDSFRTMAYRGPKYEMYLQEAIRETINIFPSISPSTVRIVFNNLQLSNTGSGMVSPLDLLAMVTTPVLDDDLKSITKVYAERLYNKMPGCYMGQEVEIQEMYFLFLVGILSQGIQPLNQMAIYELFIYHSTIYFRSSCAYTVDDYFLFISRVVRPNIPLGSKHFKIISFDHSVVIENILVPEPWRSNYEKSRDTIIKRLVGLQGSSDQITKRLIEGGGEKGYIKNIVNLKPAITPRPQPTYDAFEYQNVLLSSQHMQRVAFELAKRFEGLKEPSFRLPLLKILVRANLVTDTGDKAAAAFLRLFQGLPVFSRPSSLSFIVEQLREYRLQTTKAQIKAALDQFFVATKCLGYVIPQQKIPSIFLATVGRYLSTLPTIPKQPFDYNFLEYLRYSLASIIEHLPAVGSQSVIDDYAMYKIFSIFGHTKLSIYAKRIIIKYINEYKLLPKAAQNVPLLVQYQQLMESMVSKCSVSSFILSKKQLTTIQSDLYKSRRIRIELSLLVDINYMAYFAVCQSGAYTAVMNRYVYQSIISYTQTVRKPNYYSAEFFRILVESSKGSKLPVSRPPLVQYRRTPKRLCYIVPGIVLYREQLRQLVTLIRPRFTFVSMRNIRSIVAHTILILRARYSITQNNCYGHLTKYYNGIPINALGAFDAYNLLQTLRVQPKRAAISSVGIQSAMAELYMHMRHLQMPFPSDNDVRITVLRNCLSAYSSKGMYRNVPFGRRFFAFLNTYLPMRRTAPNKRCMRYKKSFRC